MFSCPSSIFLIGESIAHEVGLVNTKYQGIIRLSNKQRCQWMEIHLYQMDIWCIPTMWWISNETYREIVCKWHGTMIFIWLPQHSERQIHQGFPSPWRIHGNGIFTYMNGLNWFDQCREIYNNYMDPCECDISMKLEENVCNTGCGTQVCFGKLIHLTS